MDRNQRTKLMAVAEEKQRAREQFERVEEERLHLAREALAAP